MKQTFAVIVVVILSVVGFFYWKNSNIKNVLCVTKSIAPSLAINRVFGNKEAIDKWMPEGAKNIGEKEFLVNDCKVKIGQVGEEYNVISINANNVTYKSLLQIQTDKGESELSFDFKLPDSLSFFERIKIKNKIQNCGNDILKTLTNYLQVQKNIYGIGFAKSHVTDSTLISYKDNSNEYPSIDRIYKNIDILFAYSKLNNAKLTNAPMLNIYKNGVNDYDFTVALPIDKFLLNSAGIIAKRMLYGGNQIISDTIIGNRGKIDNFLKEIDYYKNDNLLISPAIPFESLITDRRLELDSNKWKTKLYVPIF